jgi:hypothetical protein
LNKPEKGTLALATGAARGKFSIGPRAFWNKPLVVKDVNELMLGGADANALIIQKLNDRLADDGPPIDLAFLEENLSLPDVEQLHHVLIHGRVRDPN